MKRILTILGILLSACGVVNAQVGEYRNDLSVGVNGGVALSRVAFVPTVPQTYHMGATGGLSFRYVCEKYFSTICSVYAELNYVQIGWKENILDISDQPVINPHTNLPEESQRTMNYLQLPVFAHLAWGREKKGLNFFVQAGPQLGIFLSEKQKMNFEIDKRNSTDRVNNIVRQDSMFVEHKFDYGIAVGLGVEYSHPKVGHFLLEGRYYYGLGNMYGDTKRDYFARSNFNNIVIKLTYLFDLIH